MARMAKLERVLGCTACPSSIAIDQNGGPIAYAAGSTVVLQYGQHQAHLVNNSKNNITCIDIAPNGKYLATGEFGNRPMVRVWELSSAGNHTGVQVAELAEHNLGILVVKFTADSNQLFSVGSQHDKNVVLWDWRRQVKASSGKITNQVNAASLSVDGSFFVTVGVRHVKFWTVGSSDKVLPGKSAILNSQRNNTFLDVCCASGNRTFVLNNLKRLIEFRNKQIHDIYELDGGIPKALCMGPPNQLFVGFTNGIIRVIDIETWMARVLPGRPHHLRHDIAAAGDLPGFFNEVKDASTHGATFPDVRALLFHEATNKLTAFYTDRSFYQWHLLDFENLQETMSLSNRFHVGAILDMEIVSKPTDWLPAGTFITSGVDYTIRFWSMDKDGHLGILNSNVLSPELKKVLYLAEDDKLLHDPADSHSGMIFSDPLDSTTGAKCLRLSPDGKHLAAGFRDGNLIVFDVTTPDFNPLVNIDAHEGETMCVEYADPGTSDGRVFLASGGRDRLIHVFDAENEYTHLSTLDDHSSSVVSVRFIPEQGGYKMFTCATDRLIVIRRLSYEGNDVSVERLNQISINSGPNYLVIAPDGNSLMLACQDRQLRTYSITGKSMKAIKGTLCEEGMLTKLALDPSGTYAATICSDRYVYIIDVATGECAAVLNGQTDCVTSIAFTPDCRRLVVVSHSGCVFVWRLSAMLTKRMTAKMGGASLSSSSPTGEHR
uniref:WD_REPEATS_REGION domain-containing protein n=1 Tax=Panagrellus redivivus TaxID=6233 RepID=A0A7E4V5I5_PANRE